MKTYFLVRVQRNKHDLDLTIELRSTVVITHRIL